MEEYFYAQFGSEIVVSSKCAHAVVIAQGTFGSILKFLSTPINEEFVIMANSLGKGTVEIIEPIHGLKLAKIPVNCLRPICNRTLEALLMEALDSSDGILDIMIMSGFVITIGDRNVQFDSESILDFMECKLVDNITKQHIIDDARKKIIASRPKFIEWGLLYETSNEQTPIEREAGQK